MKQMLMLAVILLSFLICPLSAGINGIHKQEIPGNVFSVRASKLPRRKTSCLFLCSSRTDIKELTRVVADDFEFSEQFSVKIIHDECACPEKPTSAELKKFFRDGYDLCVCFVPRAEKSDPGVVRVQIDAYQTKMQKCSFEKHASFKPALALAHGHLIADKLLDDLTGAPGVFKYTLAYCEAKSLAHKVIVVSDYTGKQRREVVTTRCINLAPTWHPTVPALFFSQLTRSNARLQMLDLRTSQEKTCFAYSGLNMQFTVATDGIRAVVCLSGGKGNSELFHYDQNICNKVGKKVFKQITANHGNNVSPCYLPNDNIIFCSDFETGFGRPQLYYLDVKKNKTVRLTNGRGYCAAPSYCAKTNSLIYTRLVNKTFQLFSIQLDGFNLNAKIVCDEKQLTFGPGDKTEPQWDKTGRYAVFLYEFKNQKNEPESQVAVFNSATDTVKVVTTGPSAKSFPVWTDRIFY